MEQSLKNNHVQACDGERITLHCPRNTYIIVENTFYGRLVPSSELCAPPKGSKFEQNDDTSCDVVDAYSVIHKF
ncbi:unnamed protein product [Dracunculus medinensis]|uniref:SUEL-type lectin domain-containing protein n=1 Tax=Dracunculus medinensis TaxID=318479 RepID=A0A0N4UIE4_DRAME|nr:unnamed protein product [Dracunculus medinensis]